MSRFMLALGVRENIEDVYQSSRSSLDFGAEKKLRAAGAASERDEEAEIQPDLVAILFSIPG